MRKITLLITFALCSTFAFSATTTHTWYFGSSGFSIGDSTAAMGDGILTTGYRGITCSNDSGFYYGLDIALGLPTVYIYLDSSGYLFGYTNDNLFMSLKVPLGYRWAGEGHNMGFYIGGAPALQMIADFDTRVLYGIGAVAELGFQTNKTKGVGFHFGFQIGISPTVFSLRNGSLTDTYASEAAIQFGISWRRAKK